MRHLFCYKNRLHRKGKVEKLSMPLVLYIQAHRVGLWLKTVFSSLHILSSACIDPGLRKSYSPYKEIGTSCIKTHI